MDLVKIKNMVRENGDKVIFMENGEPELVMMSFMEYEKMARLQLLDQKEAIMDQVKTRMNESATHRVDEDMMQETEFIAPIETVPVRSASVSGYGEIVELARKEPVRSADIRLEDLPI